MTYKEWVKQSTVEVDDLEILKDEISYIGLKDESILKTVYKLLKDINFLNVVKLYKVKNHDSAYTLAFKKGINVDGIFGLIRFLNGMNYLDNISKEYFKDFLVAPDKEIIDNGNFYCLFTLNHAVFNLDFIEEIEKILNKNITFYTNLDLLYEEFKESMKDETFSAIVKSNFPDCSGMVFNTIEELNEYKNYWRNINNEDDDNGILTASTGDLSKSEITEILDKLAPNLIDKLGANPENVKVSLFDPNKGTLIDIDTYRKKNNDKLN